VPKTGVKDSPSLVVNSRSLENEFYRVEVGLDGTITLVNKESGEVFTGLGFFEDSGDAGDEYNHSPPVDQKLLLPMDAKLRFKWPKISSGKGR